MTYNLQTEVSFSVKSRHVCGHLRWPDSSLSHCFLTFVPGHFITATKSCVFQNKDSKLQQVKIYMNYRKFFKKNVSWKFFVDFLHRTENLLTIGTSWCTRSPIIDLNPFIHTHFGIACNDVTETALTFTAILSTHFIVLLGWDGTVTQFEWASC